MNTKNFMTSPFQEEKKKNKKKRKSSSGEEENEEMPVSPAKKKKRESNEELEEEVDIWIPNKKYNGPMKGQMEKVMAAKAAASKVKSC